MVISLHRSYSPILNFLFDAKAAGRKLGQGFTKVARKSFDQIVDELFDQHLYPFANQVEYMANSLLGETEEVAKQIIDESIEQVSDLLEDFFKEAKTLLAPFQPTTVLKTLIEPPLREVERLEAKLFQDANDLVNRVREKLLEPTLKEIERLEAKLFQDANALLDRFEEVMAGQIEKLKHEILKFRHLLPAPWDRCKRQLNLHWKSGLDLSDLEIYRLMECYELSRLDENTPIKKIVETYAQLQNSAVLMKHLASGAPEFQKIFIKDWFKYGQLCEFWQQYI